MTTTRIPVGSKVKATGNWRARHSTLTDDDIAQCFRIYKYGTLVHDDKSSIPYRVRFIDGRFYWYYEEEIELVEEEMKENYEEKYNSFLFICVKYLKDLRDNVDGYSEVDSFLEFADIVDSFQKFIKEKALAKLTDEEKKALRL